MFRHSSPPLPRIGKRSVFRITASIFTFYYSVPTHTARRAIITKGTSKRKHPQPVAGSCFIVGTPIGEQDDFTQRGVRTLQSADIIVAPDEKEAVRLLKRFAIAKPLLGTGEELTDEVATEVMDRLHKGERVVIMSASAIALAEPVRLLANKIRRAGLEPRVIPGVDLVMMALQMSGFPADRYFVGGFIPMRREPREEFVRALSERPETAIVFASAPRLTSTLAGLAMRMPDRKGVVILKPTVPGEIALRGTLYDLRERLSSKMLSGMATIVLGPQGDDGQEETDEFIEEVAEVEVNVFAEGAETGGTHIQEESSHSENREEVVEVDAADDEIRNPIAETTFAAPAATAEEEIAEEALPLSEAPEAGNLKNVAAEESGIEGGNAESRDGRTNDNSADAAYTTV